MSLTDPPKFVHLPVALVYGAGDLAPELRLSIQQIAGWMWVTRDRAHEWGRGKPLGVHIDTLAARWGISQRTVQWRLQVLAARGYLEIRYTGGGWMKLRLGPAATNGDTPRPNGETHTQQTATPRALTGKHTTDGDTPRPNGGNPRAMALRENGNSGGSRAMPLRENSDSGDPRAMPLRENSDSGDPRAMPLRENSDSGDPRAMPLRGPNINNSVVVVVPFSPEEQQQQQHNINQAALEKLLAIGIWESTAEELAADPWITVDRIERALADLMAQERAGQTWRTNRQAVLISNLRAHREPPRRRPPEDDRRRFVSGEYADIIEH